MSGAENLPKDGVHVYAPNHPGYTDPVMLRSLVDGDIRFMAAIELFERAPLAKAMDWGGAFPVNRGTAHPATMEHASDLLKKGASLGIFPEGRLSEKTGELGPIKVGAALFAVRGGAESSGR